MALSHSSAFIPTAFISTVKKEIRFNVDCVLYDGQKIFEDGIGSFQTSLGVTLGYLGNLKPKMGIGSMNEIQGDLFFPTRPLFLHKDPAFSLGKVRIWARLAYGNRNRLKIIFKREYRMSNIEF